MNFIFIWRAKQFDKTVIYMIEISISKLELLKMKVLSNKSLF